MSHLLPQHLDAVACKVCAAIKPCDEFYPKDRTCKECRKSKVRLSRAANADHYQEYDRTRYKNDPRVKDRIRNYSRTEAGKAAGRRAKDAWLAANPIKRAAQVKAGNAIRDGQLTKPDWCETCLAGQRRLHGHHDDYAKPLIVRWLCSPCHHKWHAAHGEAANAS